MKRSRLTLATLALAASLPFAASAADGLSYNYVQGGYMTTNTDGGDADGWALKGSAALTPNFHLFGDFANQEIDGTDAYDKFDAGGGAEFDGYSVEAGVRGAMTPMLEGYALAGYEDGDEFDGDFYGRLGAQLKFNTNWGVAADVKVADGDTQWFVGPRLTW